MLNDDDKERRTKHNIALRSHRKLKRQQRRHFYKLDPRDERLIFLESRIRALKKDFSVENIYAIVLSGHSVYKGGTGLPHQQVLETITRALNEEGAELNQEIVQFLKTSRENIEKGN